MNADEIKALHLENLHKLEDIKSSLFPVFTQLVEDSNLMKNMLRGLDHIKCDGNPLPKFIIVDGMARYSAAAEGAMYVFMLVDKHMTDLQNLIDGKWSLFVCDQLHVICILLFEVCKWMMFVGNRMWPIDRCVLLMNVYGGFDMNTVYYLVIAMK